MYIKEASDFSSSKFFSRPAKRYHIGERYKAIHQKNYLASRLNFQFGTTQNSFIFWLYCCFFISHFHDVFFIADFYRNKNHGIVFISVIFLPFRLLCYFFRSALLFCLCEDYEHFNVSYADDPYLESKKKLRQYELLRFNRAHMS